MYRQLGIGDALLNVLREGMATRGAEGELAIMVEGSNFGRRDVRTKIHWDQFKLIFVYFEEEKDENHQFFNTW